MSNVIGIPLIKGNNLEIIPAVLDKTVLEASTFEGTAAFHSTADAGTIEPGIVHGGNSLAGTFAGFMADINLKAHTVSILKKALLVAIPMKKGDSWNIGEQVQIHKSTGLVDKSGTIFIDARIKGALIMGVNGSTGVEMPCVLIDLISTKTSATADPADAPTKVTRGVK